MTLVRLLGNLQKIQRGASSPAVEIGELVDNPDHRIAVGFREPPASLPDAAADLLWLATGLLKLEEILEEKRVRPNLELEVVVSDPGVWEDSADTLGEILHLAMARDFDVRFVEGRGAIAAQEESLPSRESVVLFSGGVDSLTGALLAKEVSDRVAGLYVGHVASLTPVVERLERDVLGPAGVPVWKVHMRRTKEILHQMRGFAYAACGLVAACLAEATSLEISECGVTMYQPALLPNDIVTLTTHPDLLRRAQLMARAVLARSSGIREPFENMTKAEMMAWCPQPQLLGETQSCVSSRFANAALSHCGKCWGCLIKRASALVAGVREPGWAQDVLALDLGTKAGRRIEETISGSSCTDLFLLLDLARKTLDDNLPWWTQTKIDEFGKQDLFRRFALDIFAALHLLYGGSGPGRNRYAARTYRDALRAGTVTADVLENRIGEVRGRTRRPDRSYLLRA